MFLGQFAVFAAYGIATRIHGTGELSVSETVTTISLVNLVLIPLRDLLYAIPDTFSAISCLQRIQEFLVQDSRRERRQLSPHPRDENLPAKDKAPPQQKTFTSDIELQQIGTSQEGHPSSPIRYQAPAIWMSDAAFGWNAPSATDVEESPQNRTFTFEPPSLSGSLTVVIGPVGCGKSTFLKAILGETAFLQGKVALLTTEVAYCAQDPWLINGSIRDNITGMSNVSLDEEWYSAVLASCSLDLDLAQMQHGDKMVVGSKGIKLSGGQKQRIVGSRQIPPNNVGAN